MAHAFIGLGSNLNDRLALLRRAARRLALDPGVRLRRCSPVYESAPRGPVREQPPFLNAVCEVTTALAPRDLLGRLLAIESDLGRVREIGQGPRTIDLDLLLYDALIVREPDLVVPHPRLAERAFVLVPLVDLAPDLVPPGLGEPVRLLRERVRDQQVTAFATAAALV